MPVIPEAYLEAWRNQGLLMLSLHAVAILASAAVLDRAAFWLFGCARRSNVASLKARNVARPGHTVVQLAEDERRADYLVRVARAAGQRGGDLDGAVQVARVELVEMDRHVAILDWAIAVAPLLGILGTATGIARAFGTGAQGLPDAGAVGGGIALALKTTIWGLSISILAATFRHVFKGIRQRAAQQMQAVVAMVSHARSGN